MVQDIFFHLSLVLVTALVISFLMRLLKQPAIIGYILTGILISPFFLQIISQSEVVLTFSHIGVAFLLFIVGLHLDPNSFKEVGFASFVVAFVQMLCTALVGFLVAYYLGFSFLASTYIGIALIFSSTIIVMKLLHDKGDLESMYGKISTGVLILQDLVVIIILMIVSTIYGTSHVPLPNSIIYGIITLLGLFFASVYILPGITKFVAKNQELLFLFSVGWCFMLASLFFYLFESIEIGALLAGITLSMSPYHFEISSRVRPLRDFFIIIFFIVIGLQIPLGNLSQLIVPALIFSFFVFLFKLLIILLPMGLLGYIKRSSFLTGISLGQISEFSIILISLPVVLSNFSSEPYDILPLMTLVFVFTTISSTYLINYSRKIYPLLSSPLSLFERKRTLREKDLAKQKYEVILFGYNRIGFNLLGALDKINKKYIVVDFNPETVRKLVDNNIPCVYGDAEDVEFLKEINLDKAKMILSTIPNQDTNMLIVNKVREKNQNSIIMVMAHQIEESLNLYAAGASYVLTPHFLGGQYASEMIQRIGFDIKKFDKEKNKHIQTLTERKKQGHEHPKTEKHS